MPRTLPWLTSVKSTSTKRESTPRPSAKAKRERENDSDATPKANGSRAKKQDLFISSPTPPSSPIYRCPTEEFLIEGLSNDDIYIMVEDEFNSVAQSFTQHLHYAEYVKRKKEAKEQNAAAIQSLARPTDGVTPVSEETKRRHASDVLYALQNTGLEVMGSKRPPVESDEEKEEEDETWAGTSLHDLMTSPRKTRSLMGMQGIKSSTRAAAGFSQASGSGKEIDSSPPKAHTVNDYDETASEDDNLDLQRTPTMKPAQRTRSVKSESISSNPRSSPLSPTKRRADKVHSMDTTYRTPASTISKRRLRFDDLDELPALHNSNVQVQGAGTSPSISKAQHNNPPSKNNPQSKKSRLNEVPTFFV
ncbi:hypothetical protein BDV25DRAFT_139683 [Aspergillus avenaceus]|uniref:Uncharacterized protein n=1 Tax=Aspergillus avenaceus TaxID=36643 RepID=A0A5N6TW39_ASPAV|nr:hypothetical protein BDV25DRAFT_139683 [Aspergillus avenaceus]